MSSFKKLRPYLVVLSLAFAGALFGAAPSAFAAVKTWDGGGADNNLNTAANWAGDSAPVADDDLVFPVGQPRLTIANNYTAGTSFHSLTFSGAASTDSKYTISGNAFVIGTGGVINSMTGSTANTLQTISANVTLGGAQTFASTAPITVSGTLNTATYTLTTSGNGLITISGVVSGSGNITQTGFGTVVLSGANTTYSGNISVTGGAVRAAHASALGTAVGTTTTSETGELDICIGDVDATLAEPLILGGTGIYDTALVIVPSCSDFDPAETAPFHTITFSGAVSLAHNVVYSGKQLNAKITGTYTPGSYTFTVLAGSQRTLELPSGVVLPSVKETTYSASAAGTPVTVRPYNTAIITGTYGTTTVSGGTLKGTGTIGVLTLSSGILAPGLSPGCLNTGNLDMSGGSLQAEIGGTTACTEYDQLKVTGTVSLGTNVTTLTTSFYNSFKPKANDKFTIIDNDVSDAVVGTFKDLAEGATFTIDGYVFKISYVGGDGNDVVLTVITVPSVADTGFKLLTSSPAMIMIATIAVTGGAYVLSRKYAVSKIK